MIGTKKNLMFSICFIVIFICAFLYMNKSPDIYDYADVLTETAVSAELTQVTETIIADTTDTIKKTEIYELNYDPEDYPEFLQSGRYYKQLQLREILFSAVGDLTLASNYSKSYKGSFYEYYDLYGPGYFMENVAHIFETSDCVIANLECALTDNQDPGIRRGSIYSYKGYTKYTDIIKAGHIDVVNLANNHSFDYSQEGYDDTTAALDAAGIDYFGNGTVLIKEINGIKIGFVGSVGTYYTSAVKDGLDYLAANNVEIKIVVFHWGNMDERVANSSQVSVGHYAIDCGADLVIGHHPHVLQGIEKYKGKYIAYSIGNFIFDGNVISDIENRTSVIFQQRFVLYGSEIVDSSINIIPILVTSNAGVNNFKPKLAEGSQKDDILNKINARSAGYNP